MGSIFFAHSGGVTTTINATLSGIIDGYHKHQSSFSNLLVGENGIIGAINESLIDIKQYTPEELQSIYSQPGAAFGSCRFKLKDPNTQSAQFERILDVFKAHNIKYFIYNGGNDSQDTTLKLSTYFKKNHLDIHCMGIPKTIDNDLYGTDNCPGFGSAAKYLITSIMEAGVDLRSMSNSSTKVFILETMGRHTGWLAASTGLAKAPFGPHVILMPERKFNRSAFLKKVDQSVHRNGYCIISVAEGVKLHEDQLHSNGGVDAFGHQQLGGIAPHIASLIKDELDHKTHYAVADYLQRSARHLASGTDLEQAKALGKFAIESCLKKSFNEKMLAIKRVSDNPYQWDITSTPLSTVANEEKVIPDEFISECGMHITDACRQYLKPLIQGEQWLDYSDGCPNYSALEKKFVEEKCAPYVY
jgi:6-phosphofructokinase